MSGQSVGDSSTASHAIGGESVDDTFSHTIVVKM